MSHLFNTYARMPVSLVRGDGAWLYDDQDRRYLDALSGIAVCSLGHAHPRLADVIADQARTLVHTANIVRIPQQEALADALCDISGLDQGFHCQFRGRGDRMRAQAGHAATPTSAASSTRPSWLPATAFMDVRWLLSVLPAIAPSRQVSGRWSLASSGYRSGISDAAAEAFANHPELVAVLVEPIQGEGGVRPAPPDYLQGLRSLCDRHEALLMLDEIQTGMARTGRWFAFQHEPDLLPDVLTIAKALGNGIPIGACLAPRQRGQPAGAGFAWNDLRRQSAGLPGRTGSHCDHDRAEYSGACRSSRQAIDRATESRSRRSAWRRRGSRPGADDRDRTCRTGSGIEGPGHGPRPDHQRDPRQYHSPVAAPDHRRSAGRPDCRYRHRPGAPTVLPHDAVSQRHPPGL